MVGSSRPIGRPGGDQRDRDRDQWDRDYRDRGDRIDRIDRNERNRERFHANGYEYFERRGPSPRDRDRDRDRDREWGRDRDARMTGSNREPVTGNRPPFDRPSSVMSPRNDTSDKGRRRKNPYNDATVAKQRKASVTSHASVSESNAGRQGRDQVRDQAVAHLTDLLCQKLHWWTQREEANKHLKQVQNDLRRSGCKHMDFGSVGDLLNGQIKHLTEHEAKCSRKIEAAEQDLRSALTSFLDKYTLNSVANVSAATPAPAPASAPNSETQTAQVAKVVPKLEQRLIDQQRTELQEFKEEMKKEHESEKKLLMESLEQERRERKALEQTVAQLSQNLSKRLDESVKKVDSLSSDNTRSEALIRETNAAHKEEFSKLTAANQELKSSAASAVQVVKTMDQQQRAIESIKTALSGVLEDAQRLETRLSKEQQEVRRDLSSIGAGVEALKALTKSQDVPEALLGDLADLAKRISSHDTAIKAQGEKQNSTAREIQSLQSAFSSLPIDELKTYSEELSAIKAQLKAEEAEAKATAKANAEVEAKAEAEPSGSSLKPTRPSETEMQQMIAPLLLQSEEKLKSLMQKMLGNMANQFGAFLGTHETIKLEQGETLDAKFAMLDEAMEAIEVAEVERKKLVGRLEKTIRQQASEQESRLQEITTMQDRLENARQEARAGFEDTQLQLTHLNNWASNFTTKALYKDIVDHINATIPNGMGEQIRRLSGRVQLLETQSNEPATKRRKTPNGASAVVPFNGANRGPMRDN